MSRIGVAFDKARADGRAVLVGCMPAGFPTVEGSTPLTFALQTGDRFQELADLAANNLGEGRPVDGLGEQAVFFYSTESLPSGAGGLLVELPDGITMTTTLQDIPEDELLAKSEALVRHAVENLEAAG